MPEWIQGRDLLSPPWNLNKYLLFDLVKQGLQPYVSLKRPLEPIDLARRLTKAHDSLSGTTIGTHDIIIDPVITHVIDPVKPVAFPGVDPAIAVAKPRKISLAPRTIGEYLRDIGEVIGSDEIRMIMEELADAIYREEEVRRFLGTDIPSLQTEDADGTRSSKGEPEGRADGLPFPCDPGTAWEHVTFILKTDELVYVKTPKGEARVRYDLLGFADKRSGDDPNKTTWPLFTVLARFGGEISSKSSHYKRELPDHARLLNKHLKSLFEINESIFTAHYRKEKRYKTRFSISDQRDS